jgi:LCP family protein required for cell wall assembly
MNNFKHIKKSKSAPKAIDGFIPRNTSNSFNDSKNVKSRFRTTYRPEGSIEGLSQKVEGFTARQQFSNSDDQELDINNVDLDISKMDETKKSKRKFRFIFWRRNKDKKQLTPMKKVVRSFGILSLALLIGVSSLFAYGYIKARNIFRGDGEGAIALQKDVDPAKLNGEGDGRVNILLLGKGGPGHEAPDLTDTLLLASIDPIQNEAALVSVPRDLYVKDSNGYSTKINAIYSNAKQARLAKGNDTSSDIQAGEDAGLNAVKDSVSDVLGIPVHYYVMIDFEGFKNAINTVGGITVDVKEPLYDQSVAWLLGGNPLVADEGLQTFDGERALLYSRSRKGSARGDFDRTERQREVIVALQNKVLSLGTFSNPFKVIELLDTFGDKVRTDLNGLEEIKRLYEIGQNISADKIASVGLADPPNILVRTDNIGGLSVVVPTEGLYQYDEIRSYIRNNLRDAFLKSEDARVIILNGTSVAGLATATSEELKSYGYNVVGVDNAPTDNYVQNKLIDLTSGELKYTKSYLERRLGLTATNETIQDLPTLDSVDFVIILGTDEVNKTAN